MNTLPLFPSEVAPQTKRLYHDSLTVQVNRKGVVDLDTVKGCTAGMNAAANSCPSTPQVPTSAIVLAVPISAEPGSPYYSSRRYAR